MSLHMSHQGLNSHVSLSKSENNLNPVSIQAVFSYRRTLMQVTTELNDLRINVSTIWSDLRRIMRGTYVYCAPDFGCLIGGVYQEDWMNDKVSGFRRFETDLNRIFVGLGMGAWNVLRSVLWVYWTLRLHYSMWSKFECFWEYRFWNAFWNMLSVGVV